MFQNNFIFTKECHILSYFYCLKWNIGRMRLPEEYFKMRNARGTVMSTLRSFCSISTRRKCISLADHAMIMMHDNCMLHWSWTMHDHDLLQINLCVASMHLESKPKQFWQKIQKQKYNSVEMFTVWLEYPISMSV